MQRRTFITLLGSAAALPFAARAQQAMPVVGFLRSTSASDSPQLAAAFRAGLKQGGFAAGQNVAVEERYADNRHDRLPELAAELVRKPVAVIVGNSIAAQAARGVSTTVPIVFTTGSDPVGDGLVASLSRPGGNTTGVVFITGDLGAKRLELLRQLIPRAATIGILIYPGISETERERGQLQAAAKTVGQQVAMLDVRSDSDLEAAFATLAERKVGAVLVGSGGFLFSKRELAVALAARYAIPMMHTNREATAAGGLMSYGTDIAEAHRQAGIYAARILKGEKPADLPVVQSSKFEFVINLKTAKALGLEFHPQLLATADEVIE